jgi:hypothetical protein
MTRRLTARPTRGGRGRGYRPGTMTFGNPMAPVPEETNENGPTEVDNPISIRMEFTPTADTPIFNVLSSFLKTLSKADHLVTLYNAEQTQFFQMSNDLPTNNYLLWSHFPVRQFQRGLCNIAVHCATLSTRTTLPTLCQNGIASWASSYKIKLEEDVFLSTANVKHTVWL